MEELEKPNLYSTASHNDELDFIFKQDSEDFDEIIFKEENRDFMHDFKTYIRLFRKKFSKTVREKMQKNFTNVLYITLDNPIEYIKEMRNQHPDNDIRVLVPIINIEEETRPTKKITIEIDGKLRVLEKTSISFDFFLQNRIQSAAVYEFPKNKENVQIYGIYSQGFSNVRNISEFSKLHFLAPFLKAARIAVKNFNKENFTPDIIHCENIPYYLGREFERKFPTRVKVLQIIKDFTQIDIAKTEAFWAAINLADKRAMKKICRDTVIKKCVARLFNLHNAKRFYQMKDCLRFIYKNYYKFRKYIDKGEDIDENIIFNRLNSRIIQLFPNIAYGEELYFNPMLYTLKKCDFWATTSKTYYKEIFENPQLSGKLFRLIEKSKEKSGYISFGCDLKKYPRENTRMIYECFNTENFREMRSKNKTAILKEFSSDRIKTNFVDPTLFKGEGVKIYGSLDSFYESPLLFANPAPEIFANGVDILFNTILKLFELHKNIQVIISIKDGMKINFVRTWIEFLSNNKYLNGRWVFIDGEINPPKFLAASDMILIPRRANMATSEHYIAMNYGCVPIAARNGILNDTIPDIFDDIVGGCGFKTKTGLLTEEDTNELYLTPVLKALNIYQNNPNSWNLLIKNCMNRDSSWSLKILERYNRIYQELL